MRKSVKIVLSGAALGTTLLVGYGIGSAGTSTTMAPPVASSPVSNAAPATPAPVQTAPATQAPVIGKYGEPIGSVMTVTDDSSGSKWTVTVNSINTYHAGQYDEAAGTGYHYIVANVTYKSITGKASPNSFDWESKDSSGQTRETAPVSSDTSLSSNDIDAGQKATGDVYFKIKDGSNGNTIVYSPGLSEGGSWAVPAFT